MAQEDIKGLFEKGVEFEGRLSFEGTLRIGGAFKGEIFTPDTLIINPGAMVEAKIEADTVIVSGAMTGHIFAKKRVVMHPPARFKGSVTTPSLKIDEGVVFEGATYMKEEKNLA